MKLQTILNEITSQNISTSITQINSTIRIMIEKQSLNESINFERRLKKIKKLLINTQLNSNLIKREKKKIVNDLKRNLENNVTKKNSFSKNQKN